MYRMIWIEPKDCDYQRIVWRFDPKYDLQEYRLLTVVYGLSPSPYLALRTIKQLISDEGDSFPLAVHALQKNTFVDDIACGANSIKGTLLLQEQLISLLRKGGFELRKWSSSHQKLLENFPDDHLSNKPQSF